MALEIGRFYKPDAIVQNNVKNLNIQTTFDHSLPRLVHHSDPHCIFVPVAICCAWHMLYN
jgi:hypothetical protein